MHPKLRSVAWPCQLQVSALVEVQVDFQQAEKDYQEAQSSPATRVWECVVLRFAVGPPGLPSFEGPKPRVGD